MTDLISIICVSNNSECLNDFLLKGLKNQTEKYELIVLDNQNKEFSSAANALNEGARRASSDWLVFSHQDILMESDDVLTVVKKCFKEGLSFFGSSGVKKFTAKMISNVWTSKHDPKLFANSNNIRIDRPVKVETLDECFICMTRDAYNAIGGFDEVLCDNWHMYGVDASYTAKEKGIDVYAAPLSLLHKSGGRISKAFIHNLRAMAKKHHLKWIAAPCYHFVNFYPFMWLLWSFWQINYYIDSKRK